MKEIKSLTAKLMIHSDVIKINNNKKLQIKEI